MGDFDESQDMGMSGTIGVALPAQNGSKQQKIVVLSFEDFNRPEIRDDRPIVDMEVPEWGGATVYLRAMTDQDRDRWEFRTIIHQQVEADPEKFAERQRQETYERRLVGTKAQLVARCVVNPQGERILSDEQAGVLQLRNSAAINRLAERCFELCGLTPADLKKLEEAKNARSSQTDDVSST